jgi:hypothetical protein
MNLQSGLFYGELKVKRCLSPEDYKSRGLKGSETRHVRAPHGTFVQNSEHVYRHITLSYFKQPVRA